jgi:hypothetical protein
MLIRWLADYKYKAVADFVSAMYVYHADLDVYLPAFAVIDGKTMRSIIDLSSGKSLAYEQDAHDMQLLTTNN